MTFNTRELERILRGGQQFAILAEAETSDRGQHDLAGSIRTLVTSREFFATMVRAGRRVALVEVPSEFQSIADDLQHGRITAEQFSDRLTRGFLRSLGEPAEGPLTDRQTRTSRHLAQQILAARAEGVRIQFYDNPLRQDLRGATDPIARCFGQRDFLRQLLGERGMETAEFYYNAANTRDRLTGDEAAARRILALAGTERAVVIPGVAHVATPRGLDDFLGRGTGRAIVVNLHSDIQSFQAYAGRMRSGALQAGLDFSQPPDISLDAGTGRVLQPTAAWSSLLGQARGTWQGPTCAN